MIGSELGKFANAMVTTCIVTGQKLIFSSN